MEAAVGGIVAGMLYPYASPSAHPLYRSYRPFSLERFIFRYQFNRKSREIRQRIREGKTQPPGAVYDPRLDDGRGAHV